jgi:hypothetical protein
MRQWTMAAVQLVNAAQWRYPCPSPTVVAAAYRWRPRCKLADSSSSAEPGRPHRSRLTVATEAGTAKVSPHFRKPKRDRHGIEDAATRDGLLTIQRAGRSTNMLISTYKARHRLKHGLHSLKKLLHQEVLKFFNMLWRLVRWMILVSYLYAGQLCLNHTS